MAKAKKFFWVLLGLISLALGLMGIFIPFLPTTPFLLLSAGLFLKGSNSLYTWLITNKLLGTYIKNFRELKAIPLLTKAIAVATLWATILLSIFFFTSKPLLQVFLLVVATGVTIHILHYRTLEKIDRSENNFRK